MEAEAASSGGSWDRDSLAEVLAQGDEHLLRLDAWPGKSTDRKIYSILFFTEP